MRVQVLGALKVSDETSNDPHLSRAVRRLVAVLAAARAEGVDRDAVAVALWGDPPPESWKSALRNRVTAARKILGVDTIQNDGGRFRFADGVTVDSWELIAHSTSRFNGDGMHEMSFLEGEPFTDLDLSELLRSHVDQIVDARAALVQEVVGAGVPLSPLALRALRAYQRRHQLDAIVTTHAVMAHMQAGLPNQATKLIAEVRALRSGPQRQQLSWVANLDRLIAGDKSNPVDRRQSPQRGLFPSELAARAELFRSATRAGRWTLAAEIATSCLPEAELSEGDPARLELLEAIPVDQLERTHQTLYCLAVVRHLIYASRVDDARQWLATARRLSMTATDELQIVITSAMLDNSGNEQTPIPLPEGFSTALPEHINMRSMQVSVLSHIERLSFSDAEPLRKRYSTLVEASGEPYRRWHLLLLESMVKFVDGQLAAAAEAAQLAYQFGELFGIADAEMALLGQMSNAQWIHAGFQGVDDFQAEFPGSADRSLSRLLHAIATELAHNHGAVDAFLSTYNHPTHSHFAFPMILLAAPHIRELGTRAEVIARLTARLGTSAIFGSGIMHLGPVDRTLAGLADTTEQAIPLLIAAIEISDRQQMRLWQVVCRLDLALATGNPEPRRQADALATTAELRELTRDYGGIRAS